MKLLKKEGTETFHCTGTEYLRTVTEGMHSVSFLLEDLHPDLLERGTE